MLEPPAAAGQFGLVSSPRSKFSQWLRSPANYPAGVIRAGSKETAVLRWHNK
jgi:hypothetical protein